MLMPVTGTMTLLHNHQFRSATSTPQPLKKSQPASMLMSVTLKALWIRTRFVWVCNKYTLAAVEKHSQLQAYVSCSNSTLIQIHQFWFWSAILYPSCCDKNITAGSQAYTSNSDCTPDPHSSVQVQNKYTLADIKSSAGFQAYIVKILIVLWIQTHQSRSATCCDL